MSNQEIATIVLNFIALHASKGFFIRAGERLFEGIEETIKYIRRKFKGDAFAKQTLERAIEKPESDDQMVALQAVLIEKMEMDNSFVENLKQLIQDVKLADTNKVLALGKSSIAVVGDVKESTIITGNSNVVGDSISQSVTTPDGSTISGVNQIAEEAKEIDKKE